MFCSKVLQRNSAFKTYLQPFFLGSESHRCKEGIMYTKADTGLMGWKTCVNEVWPVSCNARACAWFVRVLWFYWTVWIYWQLCVIYWQLCVIHIARHLSSFQNGKEALGVKLETTDAQKVEDPLAVMLPVLKTEQEVRCMSVCLEFKEIWVCLMDF